MDTFSIQERHAYVRLLETENGSKSPLTIDDHQTDHLEQAEILEEG